MDYKNKLQEYFQKLKLPLPTYKTNKVGGEDHCPLWSSTVILHDNVYYEGDVFYSKSNAEKSAAQKAFVCLETKNTNDHHSKNYSLKTAIVIDIENMPKFFEEIPEKDLMNDNLHVYGFIGINHPLMNKMLHPKFIQVKSPSTRKDGTDTCIQVTIGCWLALEKYDQYIIVTRDHFGPSLVDMITSTNMNWKNKQAKLVTKYDDI
ncbi:MAG TPA: putative dsRNA-binding protein [Candidatus Saccharimonadales bacterium]|nr:putative dsRNA-binding protein [Candidatus Saccharimonadales bacterium]